MDEDRQTEALATALPRYARLPINRCNLPPQILGSLTFQQHPTALALDGVQALHGQFFAQLEGLGDPAMRAAAFRAFMRASFFLDQPEQAGFADNGQARRDRADYLRILRGWMFDADSREAAVLKSWVESRFGLLPRSHHGPLGDFSGANYQEYLVARTQGLYNTNALEAQLDLLYSFCQYELRRRHPDKTHLTLYRGVNRLCAHERLTRCSQDEQVLLLNNLNSFTDQPERAGEFGDQVIATEVPLAKLLYFPGLLPGTLSGEQEYLVIGGLYRVRKVDLFAALPA